MTFRAGDKVKLTDRFAAALMKRPLNKLNWAARRGVVSNVNRINVFVVWKGNRGAEVLHKSVVEVVVL